MIPSAGETAGSSMGLPLHPLEDRFRRIAARRCLAKRGLGLLRLGLPLIDLDR